MNKYLLDTNICIHFLKGEFNLIEKVRKIGIESCFVSEITIAELKYGIENSAENKKEKNRSSLINFSKKFTIIPLTTCLDIFAKEKARLKKEGKRER